MPRFTCPEGIGDVEIRKDVAESDGESEHTSVDENIDDNDAAKATDDILENITERIRRGKEFIESSVWSLAEEDDSGNCLILSPTTSNIHHFAVHGALIVCLKEPLDGFNGFAKTIGAPLTYKATLATVMSDEIAAVQLALNHIHRLHASVDKRTVHGALTQIVYDVATALRLRVNITRGDKMAVGGILAHSKYDVRGATDIVVRDHSHRLLLVIEVKTQTTFDNENWYRDCRAAQVLTPLYFFNAPTFLATNKCWKVFFENSERDSVFTYPTRRSLGYPHPDDFINLLTLEAMGRQFVTALIICLTAKTPERLDAARNMSPERPGLTFDSPTKSRSQGKQPKEATSHEKLPPPKRSKVANTESATFESKNLQGETEIVQVRIYTADEVREMDWSTR